MGRYTTVQAYADSNPNMRTIAYSQAASAAPSSTNQNEPPKPTPVQTEKVDNPYGSAAGAGSGEFHTYRHSRARELMRLHQLDTQEAEEKADAEWQKKLDGWREEEEGRREKRRRKRERGKRGKERKRVLREGGVRVDVLNEKEEEQAGEEEFEYKVLFDQDGKRKEEDVPNDKIEEVKDEDKKDGKDSRKEEGSTATSSDETVVKPPSFKNDGSFLEMMKRKMEMESAASTFTDDTSATTAA